MATEAETKTKTPRKKRRKDDRPRVLRRARRRRTSTARSRSGSGLDRPPVRDGRPRRARQASAPGSATCSRPSPTGASRCSSWSPTGEHAAARWRISATFAGPGASRGSRPRAPRSSSRAATCSTWSTRRSWRTTPTPTAPISPSRSGSCRPSGSAAERAMTGAFNAKTAAGAARPQAARALSRSLSPGIPSSACLSAGGGDACAGAPPCRAGGDRRASTRAVAWSACEPGVDVLVGAGLDLSRAQLGADLSPGRVRGAGTAGRGRPRPRS